MLRKLQELARRQQFEAFSDADLLERFRLQADQAAFAELLRRHSKMVLACCRRWLGDEAEAEDACQATFLILAKKAGQVAWSESISGWLHRVAVLISRKQARAASKRRQRERSAAKPERTSEAAHDARELPRILDEELLSLPKKFQAPIVLCCLEELSYEEAAQRLSISEGALRSRLFRGREALRQALARRGVELAGVWVLVSLAATASASGLPASKIASTITAAASCLTSAPLAGLVSTTVAQLVQGGLQMLFIAKLKTWAAALLVGVLIAGVVGGGPLLLANATRPDAPQAPDQSKADADTPPPANVKKSRRYKDPTHYGLLGAIEQLDLTARRVTLKLNGQNVPLKLELAANCTATICDEPGELSEVKKGQEVVLRLSNDLQQVVNIETFTEDDTDAVLSELRLDDRKMTVQHDGQTKTYPVKSNAIVVIDGFLAHLDSLDVGMNLQLWFTRDRKTITRIITSYHQDGDLVGQLKSVDVAASQVTLLHHEEDQKTEHVFPISPKTRLIVNGKPGQLSDLKPPMVVRVRPSTPINGVHTHVFAWTDDE